MLDTPSLCGRGGEARDGVLRKCPRWLDYVLWGMTALAYLYGFAVLALVVYAALSR